MRLDEDMHTHSTFSDGRNSLMDNARAAQAAGVRRLGCSDHVRRDSDWLELYVRAIDFVSRETGLEMVPMAEAKFLDEAGALDVPDDLRGVCRVLAADHRLPWNRRLWSPREVRERLRNGSLDPVDVVDAWVDVYTAAMARRRRLLLAHPLSFLARVGIGEGHLSTEHLERLAEAALCSDAEFEVSERWRCPGAATVTFLWNAGVGIRASTDAHKSISIGQYRYVRGIAKSLTRAKAG